MIFPVAFTQTSSHDEQFLRVCLIGDALLEHFAVYYAVKVVTQAVDLIDHFPGSQFSFVAEIDQFVITKDGLRLGGKHFCY